MINQQLPHSCTLNKAAKELDKKSDVYPTPGTAIGM